VQLPGIFRGLGEEEHESHSPILGEEEVGKMRAFRGFAVFLMVVSVSGGIFILYDSRTRQSATSYDAIIPGAVLFSLALTLLYFISRPAVK